MEVIKITLKRGLNENANGLVLQYLSKDSNISHLTDENPSIITNKLNTKPTKTLGCATPDAISSQKDFVHKV